MKKIFDIIIKNLDPKTLLMICCVIAGVYGYIQFENYVVTKKAFAQEREDIYQTIKTGDAVVELEVLVLQQDSAQRQVWELERIVDEEEEPARIQKWQQRVQKAQRRLEAIEKKMAETAKKIQPNINPMPTPTPAPPPE